MCVFNEAAAGGLWLDQVRSQWPEHNRRAIQGVRVNPSIGLTGELRLTPVYRIEGHVQKQKQRPFYVIYEAAVVGL